MQIPEPITQTKILSKFYVDPPLDASVNSDGDGAGGGDTQANLGGCDQPRVEFLDDGTPIMPNEEWFKLYLSCIDGENKRDAKLQLWEKWAINELKEQELNNAKLQ